VIELSDVVYTSHVTVTREHGPIREARIPGCDQSVSFGVHSEIAEHYGVSSDEYPPTASTLDYIVAAAAG
jgi:hypothetical protein